MNKKEVPINKGNYSMEPPEREQSFEAIRAAGWEEGYYEYRRNWEIFAEEQIVSEYPLSVDIETSSLCNLRCPMCFTITEKFKSKIHRTLIKEELYYKIIDEISGRVPSLRLSLRGEPTLHPCLPQFVKYAKEKGMKEVSFLTNGSKLSEEYFIMLLEAGVDWITISIDGLGETYENIRTPNKFNDIFDTLKMIKRVKDSYGVKKPVIKVQTIWPAIREAPETYYNTLMPYTDLIAFNPIIDYLGNDTAITYMENFCCPQIYQRIIITSDGIALACTNDELMMNPLGDTNTQTIYDIWHGDRLNKIRKTHKQKNGFKEIELCKKCFIPRTTEDSETACVNGREFTIKNYVGRKQNIGE